MIRIKSVSFVQVLLLFKTSILAEYEMHHNRIISHCLTLKDVSLGNKESRLTKISRLLTHPPSIPSPTTTSTTPPHLIFHSTTQHSLPFVYVWVYLPRLYDSTRASTASCNTALYKRNLSRFISLKVVILWW